ncbi:sodium-dependent bicarbonate transport family permease [Lignipirellula cremea]|uniref:Sodium-dependent bicarbonate transport family permease n=1 Tax=Lignipirellula cremea TaxID=2528010 RepID=A0A518DZV3_9BACT|nr:sodium-dependent bicarbonate transport family permease [Lignipirellula cremea]QDU97367.1 hypothetical protein Pla8534_52130 [Lignipirellula cremea]
MPDLVHEFLNNFAHNLFKPLLLFFYMGFLIPILKVPFEFPKVLYQSLTLYLLIAIGWHGGEELASLSTKEFGQAGGFMVIGFFTNLLIGIVAYFLLRAGTRLRKIDAATVAGFYGSDSAGTFVTCVGVLGAGVVAIPYAAYMPVMLAIMEIPGCLVALYLVSRLRAQGMDVHGNMEGEEGYISAEADAGSVLDVEERRYANSASSTGSSKAYRAQGGGSSTAVAEPTTMGKYVEAARSGERSGQGAGFGSHGGHEGKPANSHSIFSLKMMHEVFLNPGLFLLFGGIVIGFVGRSQGVKVTADDDKLFVSLFHPILCLFLLEMGITACRRLRDLRTAGWRFIAFAILGPNVFAAIGICIAHLYSMALGEPFDIGTYALFAVLCGAASYIAVPAVQRLAIPEASPTLPLAASLGLTFTYNVTIGIPVYILMAQSVTAAFPVEMVS